jgi:hypothetical protein
MEQATAYVVDGEIDSEAGRQAAVLWLLLSIEHQLETDKSYRIDDLFGLSEDDRKNGDAEALEDWNEFKALIIRTCGKFLAELEGLDANERYDALVDEIDRYAEDADVSFLWNLVRLVYGDGDYAGNKRRVLRHLCRKAGLDRTALPALENAAKTIAAVQKEREALTASDRPYREVTAALAALDRQERETRNSLEELGVVMGEEREADENEGASRYREATIVDKLGDAAVEVINGVADGIEGIINGFTSAFTRLM